MDGDIGDAEDERAVELSSVAAIYPELTLDAHDPFSATIDIPVEPVTPLSVLFEPPQTTHVVEEYAPPSSASKSTPASHHSVFALAVASATKAIQDLNLEAVPGKDSTQLYHLPPVHLEIRLPQGYPSVAAPVFAISTRPAWLPEDVCRHLLSSGQDLWEDFGKDQVVFAYIDKIREEAEKVFGLNTSRALRLPLELEVPLLDFDRTARRVKFEQGTFVCGVCLEPKKGTICHRLASCGHVFCVDCLQSSYTTYIDEGDVSSVKCFAPGCGKEAPSASVRPVARRPKTIPPSELLTIPLPQETVQRYIILRRKKALESSKSTIYCPRQWCQGPARTKASLAFDADQDYELSDSESLPDDTTEEPQQRPPETALPLFITNDQPPTLPPKKKPSPSLNESRLVICADCSFAFCAICKSSWHGPFTYCQPPNSSTDLTSEELASEQYMNLHTTPCPTCDARAQKTGGCNHMICAQCKTHFCYLCSSYLEEGNPYKHYNTKKGGCYQRLWELEAGDGDDVGRGYFGGEVGGEDIPGNPYVDDTDSEFDSDDDDDDDDDDSVDSVSDDGEDEIVPLRGPPAGGRGAAGGARGRGQGRGRGRGGAQQHNGRVPPQRQQQQQRGNPNARGRGNARQAAAGAQREPVAMVRGNLRRI